MSWMSWLLVVVGTLAVAAAGVASVGSLRWPATVRPLANRLEAARVDQAAWATGTHRYDPRELVRLPAPVQRYFRAALAEGQPMVAAVSFTTAGTFNQSSTEEKWRPFTSRQRVITRRPGFLWDARISLLPGLQVRVLDSYMAGSGQLRAAVAGLFTVADMHGEGDIARGEFMRFFAEAPWYPTALLPSQGVVWAPVDDRSALATMRDGPLALTLLFRFGGDGFVESVRAEARGGLVDGKTVMMPWECSMSAYTRRDGMWVPGTGEAAWIRAGGRKAYFRGALTSLAFELAR